VRRWLQILNGSIALLVLVATVIASAQAQSDPHDGWLTAVDGPVRLELGDEPRWSDPALDDSTWPQVEFGTTFYEASRAGRGPWGWYRVRVPVPAGEPVGLWFGEVAEAAQIFVDGAMLYSHGDPDAGQAGPRQPFGVVVDEAYTTDGEILVAIRVWGGRAWARAGRIDGLRVGDPSAAMMVPHADRHQLWRDPRGVPTLAVGGAMLGLGLLHAWLWIRRRDAEQGFFSIGATLLAVVLLWSAWVFMGNTVPRVRLEQVVHLMLGGAMAGMVAFARYYLKWPSPWMGRICAVALLGGGAIALFEPLPPVHLLVYVGYALAAVCVLVMSALALRRGTIAPLALVFAFGPIFAWAMAEGAHVAAGLLAYWPELRPWMLLGAVGVPAATLSVRLTLRVADTLDELDATGRAAARFVPDAVLELLGRTRISDVQRGDSVHLDMEILFCDIRGFTSLSESRTPARNFAFINDFLAAMEPCVKGNGGFLALNLGDGFMALFPVGESSGVGAAVAMQQALMAFNEAQRQAGEPAIEVGIGVHAGRVMLGTIGGRDRLDTGVVSPAVSVAEQMEVLTKLYDAPLVVSREVLRLEPRWEAVELDQVHAAGHDAPLAVFEVLEADTDEDRRDRKRSQAADYARALGLFRGADLDAARVAFASLPDREAARLFVARCDWLLARGLPEPWDGVMRTGLQ
jgi:class 3 adenylate cyclase